MDKSTRLNFNLPNSANDEIADINDISDNFRTLDNAELVTNKTSEIDVESTEEQYPTAKSVYDKFDGLEKQTDKKLNGLNEKFANALINEKVGSMLRIDDINPNIESVTVNCQPLETVQTVTTETVSEDKTVAFTTPTSAFTLKATCSTNGHGTSASKFIPVVNGTWITAAAQATHANDEVSYTYHLTYCISGTTLWVTGTASYFNTSESVSISAPVAEGAQFTGLVLSGMIDYETATITIQQPVNEITETEVTEDTTISLPVSRTLIYFKADAQSSTSSISKFVPYVNGAAISAAAINTDANIIPRSFDLKLEITGTTLSITGTKTYEYEGTQTEEINVTVAVSSNAKITGIAVSGMATGEVDNIRIDSRDFPGRVYQYRSNLFDPTPWVTPVTVSGVTYTYLPDEDCFLINGTATNTSSPRKAFSFYALGRKLVTGVKYLSGSVTVPSGKWASFYIGKGDTASGTASNFFSCTLANNDTISKVYSCDKNYVSATWFFVSEGVVFDNYKVKIQIESNDSATTYEKYAAPAELTPDADGNVTAARGDVCTFAVKSPGTLSTRYNRDINKAFDELKQAIISLGGNV